MLLFINSSGFLGFTNLHHFLKIHFDIELIEFPFILFNPFCNLTF